MSCLFFALLALRRLVSLAIARGLGLYSIIALLGKTKDPSTLELGQYQNNSIQSKKNFEIAALFYHLYGEGKSVAISQLDFFD